jgi:beta-lactamase class A
MRQAVDQEAGATADLAASLRELFQSVPGRFSVYARLLGSEQPPLTIAADEMHYAASVIKLPIMVEAFRQALTRQITLEQTLVMRESDRVGGSGSMQLLSPGVALSVWDLLRLMICVSDNTATNLLINLLGLEQLNRSFADWGLHDTHLYNLLMVQPAAIAGRNSVTAADMGRLLEQIAAGAIVSHWACERMAEILLQQQAADEISASLPDRTAALVGAAPLVRVAHKGGNITHVRHDVGLVYAYDRAYVVCLLGSEITDDATVRALFRRASRLIFDVWVADRRPLGVAG